MTRSPCSRMRPTTGAAAWPAAMRRLSSFLERNWYRAAAVKTATWEMPVGEPEIFPSKSERPRVTVRNPPTRPKYPTRAAGDKKNPLKDLTRGAMSR